MSPREAPKTASVFLLTKNVSCGIMEAIALGKPSVASKIERGLGDESGVRFLEDVRVQLTTYLEEVMISFAERTC